MFNRGDLVRVPCQNLFAGTEGPCYWLGMVEDIATGIGQMLEPRYTIRPVAGGGVYRTGPAGLQAHSIE